MAKMHIVRITIERGVKDSNATNSPPQVLEITKLFVVSGKAEIARKTQNSLVAYVDSLNSILDAV